MRINAHADNINAHLKDQKGMTLLEVVVAMSLLTFITLGLMFMVGSSYRAVTASKERSQAVSLSSTFLELLGTIPYDDLVKFDNVNTSNTATFPTNTQFKNICISWRNQIADLMNYSTAYGLVDVETNTPVSGRTRITVYVFWPRGDEFRSVNIVEVR
jgi:prepilin-type N-terminal cleavage/methylation domain-containing protein